jgi:hypothetical protein
MSGIAPGSVARWWTGPTNFFTYASSTSSGEEPMRGAPMPVGCNLTTIAMYASTNKKGISDTMPDTIMLTIFKNNSATTMTCSVTSTMNIHEVVTTTCTSNPVSFSVGDTLGLQWTQSNTSSSLFTQYGAGLRCE